jgi:UDP-3-O-acyl N-acetylglucosamine deacetylase
MSDSASPSRPTLTPRRTLARAAPEVTGIGLFTSAPSRVTIRPSAGQGGDPGGIVFRRTDLGGMPSIPATIDNVVSEQRRTVLATPGPSPVRVETVEHILSALAGLGVTDALIDMDGPEVPIGDGSALPFVEALRAAGVATIAGPGLTPVCITRPLTVGERGAQVDVLPPAPDAPALGCEYVYRLDYGPGSPIPPQEAAFFVPIDAAAGDYATRIAPARTFTTLADATAMRQVGFFTEFTPRDLLVFGPNGPVDNTLRFPDEPARHKVLDMVGDIALCGRPIVGRIVATRSGHSLNHEVARALASLS